MEPTRIINKSMKEQVYEFLSEQLTRGQIRPGEALNLDATSRLLGVSKTPLREALIMLEMEGFVTIQPRRGVFVNGLSSKDIRECYEIIGALEGSALLLCRQRLSKTDLDRMEALNAAMADAIAGDNFDSYYRDNLHFHDVYIIACGNEKLVRITQTLKKRLYDFPRPAEYLQPWERASIAEHAQLIEMLRQGRFEDGARYITDVHWSFDTQEPFIRTYYNLCD